ncbi:MAG: hypothetical protein KF754_04965 [Planctomycetes bacterium]|nr:hypothetical protein [Planctomycetota bacterium]
MPDPAESTPAADDDDGPMDVEGGIMEICRKDRRYAPAAYRFVMFEGIEYTAREHLKLKERRHLTGAEVCEGLRKLALSQFGFMACDVWRSWGVTCTRDWGNIIFNLCDHKLLQRTDTDRIEDFEGVYDLETGLRQAFRFDDAVGQA